MRRPNNIFLIGPMGAGKSSIGRQLAQMLNMDFKDSDQELEFRTGVDVAWIMELEGEEGFRRREQDVIEDLTQLQGIVLATGGGAVISHYSRSILGGRGFVVYLAASIDQLLKRTSKDKNRPLLQVDNPRLVLETIMQERESMYKEIADLEVPTNTRSVRRVADEIFQYFKKQ